MSNLPQSIPAIPKEPKAKRAWLAYQLRLRGLSYRSLAKELGLSASAVRLATWTPYRRMEELIASKLGVDPADIWPDRWERRREHAKRGGARGAA